MGGFLCFAVNEIEVSSSGRVHRLRRTLPAELLGMNVMPVISRSGPADSLVGTFHETVAALVRSWTSAYRRRRQLMGEEEELRSLDPRILADLGVEFAPEHGPAMLHSQAEAVVAATSAMAVFRKART
ncbi:MAG: hypothetical protein U1E67_07710 [Hyphomicrobiales bacterium]